MKKMCWTNGNDAENGFFILWKTSNGTRRPLRNLPINEIIESILKGFPYRYFALVAKAIAMNDRELAGVLGITPRTLIMRRREGKFNSVETDRIYRFAGIVESTLMLLSGDAEDAKVWLTSPKYGLGGRKPIDYARTEPGAREVDTLIHRIMHGIPS